MPNPQRVLLTFDVTTADGLFAARKLKAAYEKTVLATELSVAAAGTILGILGGPFKLVNIANNVGHGGGRPNLRHQFCDGRLHTNLTVSIP